MIYSNIAEIRKAIIEIKKQLDRVSRSAEYLDTTSKGLVVTKDKVSSKIQSDF